MAGLRYSSVAALAMTVPLIIGMTVLVREHFADRAAYGEAERSAAMSAGTALVESDGMFRVKSLQITLLPGQGTEVLAAMQPDDTLVFVWGSAGGAVHVDMHGDAPQSGDSLDSYHKSRHTRLGSGSFRAPFEGSHGWYWINPNEVPVTIRVTVSGYFDDLYAIDPDLEDQVPHGDGPARPCCYGEPGAESHT
jgi:hypothetical protein